MQFIILIIVLLAAGWYWRRSRGLSADERRRLRWRMLAAVAGVLLLFLVATGRLHVFAALGVVLVALLRRLPLLIRLWPLWRKLKATLGDAAAANAQGQPDDSESDSRRRPYKGGMSLEEARQILGVAADADELTIIQAHRRLMQKVHPDRGGTDTLAARANEAKARLLGF